MSMISLILLFIVSLEHCAVSLEYSCQAKPVIDELFFPATNVKANTQNCFSHVHEKDSSFSRKGEAWEICIYKEEKHKITSSLKTDYLSASDSITVNVDPNVEDSPANISACQFPAGGCNFRSAVGLCSSHMTSPSKYCDIQMSQLDDVIIQAKLGRVEVTATAGKLSIFG
jgi:hypothetical protein